eukprot:2476106-Prorocentrum_lima.AAC.1
MEPKTVSKDDLLTKTLIDEVSQPALRHPHNLVDVCKFCSNHVRRGKVENRRRGSGNGFQR